MDQSELSSLQLKLIAQQPDYPPSKSMSGMNTVNLHCVPVGYTPGYAVCLHKLAAYDRDYGSLIGSPACQRAISLDQCEARKMATMEADAGKALFFVDRTLMQLEWDKQADAFRTDPRKEVVKKHQKDITYKAGTRPSPDMPGDAFRAKQATTKQEPVVPKPHKSAVPDISAMPTFADAITKAIKDENDANLAAGPKPVDTPSGRNYSSDLIPKLASESMSEYAARVMAARNAP